MDAKTTVKALMDSVQKGDFAGAKSMLSDGFTFSGPVPKPLNSAAWLGLSASLFKGFPDLDYNFSIESVEGNKVKFSSQLKGTHTGDLDLTAMGMGVIPATHKSFANPHAQAEATVNGDMVSALVFEAVEGGGLRGILAQIGVKPPAA